MSLENRMIGSAASLAMSLAAAVQPRPQIRVDESGPEAVAILRDALVRRSAELLAVEQERDELILELNRARSRLASRPRRPRG